MKQFLLSILCVALVANLGFAQKKLSSSTTSGHYTYIYKLTDKETFKIASKSSAMINDGFLHTLVDSFYNDVRKPYTKKLPYGNYLYVNAIKNKLNYRLAPESNVNLEFINNRKDFQFNLTDPKGNLIADATVKIGKSKKARYDEKTKLYVAGSGASLPVITVKYQGLSTYFTYEKEEGYQYKKPSVFKRLFKRRYNNHYVKPKYTGYMVFNKPMYKPLDTVKFKTYLLTAKGGVIKDKLLRVELLKRFNEPGILLDSIRPYREGGYEYSFVLADSLKMTLDQTYYIVLKEKRKNKWEEVSRNNFRYEDYELKSVNFNVRTDKSVHRIGSPVTIFLKATDENELAVPDGRVDVEVRTDNVTKYHADKVFVKNVLWKTNIVLDPVGETKLILPDSIFPKADLRFSVNFIFLNSSNERKTAYKALSYELADQEIKSEFKKDSLYLEYQVKGRPVKEKATIYTSFANDDKDSVHLDLPVAIKLDYRSTGYKIKMADGYQKNVYLEDMEPNIRISAEQGRDSLRVLVNNEHQVPFWYTIFSGDKVLLKGYDNRLDTLIKHTSAKAAHIRVNYRWDEKDVSEESSAVFAPHILNVKLLAPDLVYPGQTVNMQVKVTDIDNKPVEGTDVTAYAYTSKFKNVQNVSLPDFGKSFYARKLKPEVEVDDLYLTGQMKLNWEKWSRELGLDTIEYYKFSQTKNIYAIEEDGHNEHLAVVAPFVVENGEISPVHILYIDHVPVYFSQAEQLQHYAFELSPGKHNIAMRTANRQVVLNDYEFAKGKKTIISIAANATDPRVKITESPSRLTDQEASSLQNYMIRILDNFNEEKAILRSDNNDFLLNLIPAVKTGKELLVGPFRENYLQFKSGVIDQNFIKEPAYTYTFLPGLLKQKSFTAKYGFNTDLLSSAVPNDEDYKAYPLKREEIDSLWDDYLNFRSHTINLFPIVYTGSAGKLEMKLDTAISRAMPYLKNIIIYKYNEPDFIQVYPGRSTDFSNLESGEYRVMYLFKDNRYFMAEHVLVKADGINYFEWSGVRIKAADNLSIKIDQQIKSVKQNSRDADTGIASEKIIEDLNEKYFDQSILVGRMTGKVVDKSDKTPLIGVHVKVKGLGYGVGTDANGRFELKVPERGKLVFSYIGYNYKEVNIQGGDIGMIGMEASAGSLDEVVVVGYGVQKKQSLTGAVTTVTNGLAGRVAGVMVGESLKIRIRGLNSLPAVQKPLVMVDGLPFTGDINSLDANAIASMDILKDKEAEAIYGSRGANGVVIIKTKTGNMAPNTVGELVEQQQTLRTNFSDYAIWQPKLITDAEGKAGFKVKFPDDITNWTTKLVAMNGRKQAGLAEVSIKSFKTLSANFVSPLFALAGDSIRVIGKLMNYNNVEEQAIRKFSYNGAEVLSNNVKFKNVHIDTVHIVAKGIRNVGAPADSLTFEYTMRQDNGYFDGEMRKIPLLQAGVMETKGYFNALTQDTSITYAFDTALGKVTLRAEASVFPTLLDEMEKLRRYEYLCNEQLASKLKALLLEKSVRKYLGDEFKEEKNIKELIKKLQQNKRPEGTWGWWQNSSEEMWISLHVVETLLQAQKEGYAVVLDKNRLYTYLLSKLADKVNVDQVYIVRLINLMSDKYYIKDWLTAIEKQRFELEKRHAAERNRYPGMTGLPEQSLYEKLQLMQLKQKAGIAIDVKWLLGIKKQTMFGNNYWGELNRDFWDNNIQNTLLAYHILKQEGGHQNELSGIQRYFLEQRKDGQWRNTYESSLILETILPELMVGGKKPEPAAILINKTESIAAFPFNRVIEAKSVTVGKKGNTPVYFTAYQQFNNPKPEKVSKDFKVTTSFVQQGAAVQKLKAGTLAILKVEVEVRADADYVMIEIPIPAGCSYENKPQNFWGVETHREYFKHKTSIFCTKLKQGKYNFSIELMPRYSGNYILNPAKAEMMYFPVFYGREGMKRIAVK